MNRFTVTLSEVCPLLRHGGLSTNDLCEIARELPHDSKLVGFNVTDLPGQPPEKPNRTKEVHLFFETATEDVRWHGTHNQVRRVTKLQIIEKERK